VQIDIGGNGGSVPDSFEDKLTPPDSTYQSSVSTPEGAMVSFLSTSSVDELKSFYDAAIADLGGSDIFKMDAGGGFSWAWGEGDSGGLIIVVPNTDGGNLVSVTYGSGS
jgi:hypothetical protein